MTETLLRGRHILLVEDEYLIAADMRDQLENVGAHVVGPVASVGEALDLIDSSPVNGACLDINLGDEAVFPVAEALQARGIPFVFATGYDASALPPAWRHVACFEKPVDPAMLARVL